MNTLWIVMEFTFAAISTVFTYLLVRSFLKRKEVEFNFLNSLVLVSVLTLKLLINLFFSENIIFISGTTIATAFVIGKFYFRDKLTWTIMAATFAFLAGAISEFLSGIIIVGFNAVPLGEFMQFGFYRLLGRTLSFLFLLVIIISIRQFRKSSMLSMTGKLALALCILPIASILIVQQFTMHIVDTTYLATANEVIPMLSIVIVNVFIFILVETLMRQNERNQDMILIQSQNEAQQKHINQLISNHEQIRQISHDFKHQVDVLCQLSRENQYDELHNKLSKLTKNPQALMIVKTGNPMLDTILSSKKEEATKQGIEFELNLNIQPELPYMSMDICILLGNAIDNAIEACARSHIDKKTIEMDFKADTSRFLFHMVNTVGEEPQTEGEFLKTLKSDGLRHGVGLRSIKQLCKKHGGDMTYEYDDKKFAIWLYLPIK